MIYANFGGRKVKENEKGDEICRKYATEMKNEKPQRRSPERESSNGDTHGGEEKGCAALINTTRKIAPQVNSKNESRGQRGRNKETNILERISYTEVEAEGVKSGGDIEIGIDGTGAVGSAVLVVTIGLIGGMDSDT